MPDTNLSENLHQTMQRLGSQAKEASRALAKATSKQKSEALLAPASALDASRTRVLAANEIDLKSQKNRTTALEVRKNRQPRIAP